MAMLTMNPAIRYVSLFLMAQSYTCFVVFWAWVSNSYHDLHPNGLSHLPSPLNAITWQRHWLTSSKAIERGAGSRTTPS
ncbi:hypothetical protein PAXRUDRAFT_824376 [Paxillus rubicundulus Ve08.2h10]|uniref:Uncharacterized protein n=1 Tax=Paxillus rubicundulus Ve08.2h10 TaxID=930991 RepID=A0A0D0DI76_9AGAM|nr:hypothetical protein PAXRUDRAFT_824376 [Paxillus rubicundulus Ve08.2h10]